ncbi:PQ loop repeat-domain-containing protein [Dactylonectria estremocensis]|uniref:PQ loop repeat-domain-containing protein n=1 Tax=Dactylonectria estremocensis TaxID=1079267 RepID=A0A9P9F8U9_9HYPO|nr:PQ loop repeat-domain-containing protein [Dactylonectria estremocensis]
MGTPKPPGFKLTRSPCTSARVPPDKRPANTGSSVANRDRPAATGKPAERLPDNPLCGDENPLIGALFTRLAPTAVALASYFCIADIILIAQTVYYRTVSARRASQQHIDHLADPSEESPLIARRRSSSFGLPGSQRQHTTHTESSLEPLRKIVTGEDETPDSRPWIHNGMSLLAVYLIGFAGWFVSYKAGAWGSTDPTPPDVTVNEESTTEIIGLTLGYFSAACYLCARIPQIIKNYQEQSCEGLALLFFMLSLTGNLTYGLSLVAYSQDKTYLLTALPWLMGSLGTIVQDCVIFLQFRLYSDNEQTSAVI